MRLTFKGALALLDSYREVKAIRKRNKMLRVLDKTNLAYVLKGGKNEKATETIKRCL